jgi:hypothetical protein
MALEDGIRKNIAQVELSERAALRDVIIEVHQRYYPGSRGDLPPGGVSWWFKQDEIHQATHVQGGPEFRMHSVLTRRGLLTAILDKRPQQEESILSTRRKRVLVDQRSCRRRESLFDPVYDLPATDSQS